MTTFLLEPVNYQVDTGRSMLLNPETSMFLRVDLYIEKYHLAVEFQGTLALPAHRVLHNGGSGPAAAA